MDMSGLLLGFDVFYWILAGDTDCLDCDKGYDDGNHDDGSGREVVPGETDVIRELFHKSFTDEETKCDTDKYSRQCQTAYAVDE